jgi:hypothetical protein
VIEQRAADRLVQRANGGNPVRQWSLLHAHILKHKFLDARVLHLLT